MQYSHFEYLIMSFEFVNAPATFQIYINCIFAEHMNSICVVYLDDILIYFQSLKKHKHHIHKILKWLQHYKLFVNLKKCTFSIDKVEFLEFIVSINDVMMNLQRINTIKEWLISQSFKNVQIFLRFVNFYRCFIKIYSKIADPLTGLLKDSKNEKKFKSFKWLKEAAETFIQFKNVFTTVSLLMHYDSELKNWMKTDASEHAVTEIYTQLQTSEQWHSVVYWLQKLSSMKNNYKTHNLELLVIVETFKQWHHYLKSNKYSVKILTDHNNLCEFMNVKTLNKKQAQWTVKLAVFDFVIMYKSNKTNSTNVPSRHPDYVQIINESIDKLLSIL